MEIDGDNDERKGVLCCLVSVIGCTLIDELIEEVASSIITIKLCELIHSF